MEKGVALDAEGIGFKFLRSTNSVHKPFRIFDEKM